MADLTQGLAVYYELALGHFRAGRLEEALRLCRQVRRAAPNHGGALQIEGLIALRQDRGAEAVRLLKAARRALPQVPSTAFNLGLAYAAQGLAASAKMSFAAVPEGAREYADALYEQAKLERAAGAIETAAGLLEKAVAAAPDFAEAHNNLGTLLLELGRLGQAAAAFATASARRPGYGRALDNLTEAAILLGSPEALRLALALNPALARAWFALGERLQDAACFRRALILAPEDPFGARLFLARLGEEEIPDRAPDAFVRTLFDQYADRFDEALTTRLGYTAPTLLGAAVRDLLGPGAGGLDILDAGCGTGLTGVEFRALARRLEGVDLSPNMIDKARARGVYDHLEVAELTSFLAGRPDAFDLVVAGDVLVYRGTLAPVMAAAAGALRQGGRFAFTVERQEAPGFGLHAHHRYAHSAAYVRESAAAAGFAVERSAPVATRREGDQPVESLLVVLRRQE